MSEPKPIQIIPAGLNLVAPGDQCKEGDCLQLDGFWPGSIGRLQQARGWVKKNQAADAITIDSLCEASEKLFFAGGGKLYMGVQDAATVSAIDTGYDGLPLGMAAYQGMCWVMNRGRQKRIATGALPPNLAVGTTNPSPGTVFPWQPATPPTAPTYLVQAGAKDGSGNYFAGQLQDGQHAYYVTMVDIYGYETSPSPAALAWCPTYPYPAGFTDGTVAVTMGSSAVTLSGATWGPEINGMQFLVPSEYPSITPPATSVCTIQYVDPTHGTLCDQNGVAWNWQGVTNPSVAYVIYNAQLAPVGAPGFYNSSCVTITCPAVPLADVGLIASWNLYHESPAINGPYLVNDAPIPIATTTYTDWGDVGHTQDDDSLLAMDVIMEADHDPPPACMVMASQPYNGRLVVANSADHPNRIWYTNALQPSFFPGSGNPQAGNWVDIGNDTGDGILALSVRSGGQVLLVYRQRSIWQITGDLGDLNSVIAPLIPNMGIVGPRALLGTSWGDLAVVKQGDAYGIYRVTDWEQRVSAKIEPIFTGVGSENYLPMNPAYAASCAVGFQLGRLWFSYPDGTNTVPTRTMICDVEQDQFSFSVAGRWFSRQGGFGAYLHGSLFFLGASGNKVYSLEDGIGDQDGANVPLVYQSRYEDGGNPDHEKTWTDLVISHNTQGQTLNVNLKLNKNGVSLSLGTICSTAPGGAPETWVQRQVIPIPQAISALVTDSFNAAIQISGNGAIGVSAFAPVMIDSPMILHYLLKPRKASQWDSGPTDHGITGPKIVDLVEIDMDASIPAGSLAAGGVLLFIQSDILGATLSERSPGTTGWPIACTVGGRAVQKQAVGPIEGRLFRYQLLWADGVTPFLAYKIRVRAVAVGCMLDGKFSETWYTFPMAPGA